jgi:hypothetical protein
MCLGLQLNQNIHLVTLSLSGFLKAIPCKIERKRYKMDKKVLSTFELYYKYGLVSGWSYMYE